MTWSRLLSRVSIFVAVSPVWCADCTPTITNISDQFFCPGTRIYSFTAKFPDGHWPNDGTQQSGDCTAIYKCDENNQVQVIGVKQCKPDIWVETSDGSYQIRWQRRNPATPEYSYCGATQYVSGATCGDYLPNEEFYPPVGWDCVGCTWNNPACNTNACQICVNNQCQSQCGAGLHCDGAGSCCANGCSGCQPSCSNVCGSACLDCPVCPCGFASGCTNGSPQCPPPPCNPSPIVLDAFDQGYHLTSIAHGVKFRVRPNAPLQQISWTDPGARNGWLALDRNGNGTIDDFTELFGNLTPQPWSGAPNGFLALAFFDDPANGGNGNGVIDPGDAVYSHLRVWVDANHNGISEPNELYTLQQLGIFKIDLRYHSTPFVDQYGNRFRYRGTVWDDDSHSRDACYDVFLQIQAAR